MFLQAAKNKRMILQSFYCSMNIWIQRISENWRSGLTVALVSIPLSIALAVASGATPAMGIITAVWAGLIAAAFGGSQYNIVGPAGALSGVLAAYTLVHGAEALPMLAMVSGVAILGAYALRLERYLVLIPSTVMHGFTLGVALTIGLNQINSALGLSGLPSHEHFFLNVWESISHLSAASFATTLVFVTFLAGLFLCAKRFPKLPPVVVLTPFGIALGAMVHAGILPFAVLTLGEKFPNASLSIIGMPHIVLDPSILSAAIGVAVIAIIETLISAKMGQIITKNTFNSRKEMLGLGLANIGSGMFGGLPATGVFVRTGLNIKTGATHQTSQAIHSIFIAIIAILLFRFVNFMPMAFIASVLIYAAVRMVETKHFIDLWKNARVEFLIALAVAALMIFIDTMVGLGFGTAAMLLFFIQKTTTGNFEMTTNSAGTVLRDRYYANDVIDTATPVESVVYSFKGTLSYIDAEAHEERLVRGLPQCEVIVLRMRELGLVDLDGVHAFDRIVQALESQKKTVMLTSVTAPVAVMLVKGLAYTSLLEKGMVFPNTRAALQLPERSRA